MKYIIKIFLCKFNYFCIASNLNLHHKLIMNKKIRNVSSSKNKLNKKNMIFNVLIQPLMKKIKFCIQLEKYSRKSRTE